MDHTKDIGEYYKTRVPKELLSFVDFSVEVKYEPLHFNYVLLEKMMAGRFDYVRYSEDNTKIQEVFKKKFEELEKRISLLPPGRASSLAMTKLEECYMWVGKAIRDKQIAEGGDAANQPERG